jgi:translation initiation factor IF-3
VLSVGEALNIASQHELDLVEVNPNGNPPVCKIMDYGKYLYEIQKDQKKQSKAHKSELKEIRLSFKISDNDLKVKAKRAQEFIAKGDTVRVTLRMRGREAMFAAKAIESMQYFCQLIEGEFIDPPKRMGNQIICIISKGKKDAKEKDQ